MIHSAFGHRTILNEFGGSGHGVSCPGCEFSRTFVADVLTRRDLSDGCVIWDDAMSDITDDSRMGFFMTISALGSPRGFRLTVSFSMQRIMQETKLCRKLYLDSTAIATSLKSFTKLKALESYCQIWLYDGFHPVR